MLQGIVFEGVVVEIYLRVRDENLQIRFIPARF